MTFNTTEENLRASPLYEPYKKAVLWVAGRADFPHGILRDRSIISRNLLYDGMEESPTCRKILDGSDWKVLAKTYAVYRKQDFRDRRKITVLGQVMLDLGYVRYSNHAWNRPNHVPVLKEDGVTA